MPSSILFSAADRPNNKVPSSSAPFLLLLLLLVHRCILSDQQPFAADQDVRHCGPDDLIYQYTPCDQNNKRWLYAVPRSHNFLCSAESMPPPRHALNCSVTCPAGHFLDMHSQQCLQCQPGTFSLGDRVRYEQLNALPDGFSVDNEPDEQFVGAAPQAQHCSTAGGGGWTVEEGELRYRWTHCVSTLSIALHLVRPGFAEFHYRLSRDVRALISMLQVRNAQCQTYGAGPHAGLAIQQQHARAKQEEEQSAEGEFRVQRLALRAGQNLITWSVSTNPVLSSRMEMIRLLRLDLSGLAFTPECTACPVGTFSALSGASQCAACPEDTFSGAGATHCVPCSARQWAAPRSDACVARPACARIDYHPVREQRCKDGKLQVWQRKVTPAICRDSGPEAYAPKTEQEECPICGLGMHRNPDTGECVSCPEGQVSGDGKACHQCPPDAEPEYGLFINRWDSLPPGISPNFECEFLSSDELSADCHISPSWISYGYRLETVQARQKGLALEMSLRLPDGFYAPLHSGRVSEDNPLGHISVDLELQCQDHTCQLYIVQELDTLASASALFPSSSGASQRELQMLALLNGTHARRVLRFAVTDARPRRLVFAFMRSGAVLGRDALEDRAVLYGLNVTNWGDAAREQPRGTAHRCVRCPRRDKTSHKCRPCPPGEYFDDSSTACRRCASGWVLNYTAVALLQQQQPLGHASNASLTHGSNASMLASASACSPCPPHFVGASDGSGCEFSGHFDLRDGENEENDKKEEAGRKSQKQKESPQHMHFDLSALRTQPLSATGIRVYSRDGQSYAHFFNVSLFADHPVQCRDSLASAFPTATADASNTNNEALFCRSAVVPFTNGGIGGVNRGNNGTGTGTMDLFVSSTIISRKLALVTRLRSFGQFYLSDDQLEYDSATPKDHLPLDLHFFFEPSTPSSSTSGPLASNCPNGTIGVLTLRCEPSLVAKPLVRLSRHCPDGTCDGCLYHVLVESAHGCPVCRSDDFREIWGECIDGTQRVHSIPSAHCVLSGAQTRERVEPCRAVLSRTVRMLLAIAFLMILLLIIMVAAIYRRNKALEYRYMRLVEGRDADQSIRTSCALGESDVDGSEEEEDGEEQQTLDSSRARVFFSARKKKTTTTGSDVKNGVKNHQKRYGTRTLREERTEFIVEQGEEEEDSE